MIKDIVDAEIIKRGLSPSDPEFKIREIIFFGDNSLNYRNEPFIYIREESSRTPISIVDIPIVVNIIIDYIIAKRTINAIDRLNTIQKLNSEIRDKKLGCLCN